MLSNCGKRKNDSFPLSVAEMRSSLTRNYDKLPKIVRDKHTKTDIHHLIRQDLCKLIKQSKLYNSAIESSKTTKRKREESPSKSTKRKKTKSPTKSRESSPAPKKKSVKTPTKSKSASKKKESSSHKSTPKSASTKKSVSKSPTKSPKKSVSKSPTKSKSATTPKSVSKKKESTKTETLKSAKTHTKSKSATTPKSASKKKESSHTASTHSEKKKSTKQSITVDCYRGVREIAVTPVPKEANQSSIPKWPYKTQGFFKSTGTSNALAFPGIYFPFAGRQEQHSILGYGWLVKMGDFSKTIAQAPDWFKRLCELWGDKHNKDLVDDDGKICGDYIVFLGYFAEWWQVRVSAALGGEFWERPDMERVLHVAQEYKVGISCDNDNRYKWDFNKRDFVDAEFPTQEIKTQKQCDRPNGKDEPHETNKWLSERGAYVAKTVKDVVAMQEFILKRRGITEN
jgi:chemotaxis protein histidine kinase CheA